MGRYTIEGDPNYSGRLYLSRVYIDNGGYDRNGTYFGFAEPLYWCASENCEIDRMLRAPSRAAAVAQVREWYPNAKVRP